VLEGQGVICAKALPALADGTMPLAIAAAQPSDLSTCSYVVVAGSELGVASAFVVPSPTEFGAAWAWGFSTVVGCYLIGWAVGAVLNFINSR
jgi:hypothetical protein